MNMDNAEQTSANNIGNVNIDTSSTDTSSSSFEIPEVVAAGRPPTSRARKSHLQATQIAELPAQLLAREEEIEGLQQRVLNIMTSRCWSLRSSRRFFSSNSATWVLDPIFGGGSGIPSWVSDDEEKEEKENALVGEYSGDVGLLERAAFGGLSGGS
jgi:hypothetical protein